MTSKTLLFKGECGQGICMRIPPPTQVPGTNFAVVNDWTSIKWTNTPVNSTINKLLSNGHIIVSAILSPADWGHLWQSHGRHHRRLKERWTCGWLWDATIRKVLVSSGMDSRLMNLARANSSKLKRHSPILLDARSVISRVARASFPCSPMEDVSCLTYWATLNEIQT